MLQRCCVDTKGRQGGNTAAGCESSIARHFKPRSLCPLTPGQTWTHPGCASEIVQEIANRSGIVIALIGLLGVIVGALIAAINAHLLHIPAHKKDRQLEGARKKILLKMLEATTPQNPNRWRSLSTLSRVIGASEEETKRLLISIDARGSENGDVWGLLKYHPLSETK